ncbi:MAG: carbohydrate-binding protein [Actinobacteria bacterium]|nr:MAG: carbohydrate-binding protein [Actinomycetota bacterium]
MTQADPRETRVRRTHRRLVRAGAVLAGGLLVGALVSVGLAQAAATRYEAEKATVSQGVVATNHLNYSGTGFVDYNNVAGSYVQWSVSASAAGTATLTIGYANGGTTDRPMTITVNGTVVTSSLSFPATGSWDTWKTKVVSAALNAGTNTVRATANTAAGGPNVDYLDVSVTASADYQAENATLSQAVVATNHANFLGTGFVDYTNVAGGYVEFTVNAASAGTVGLAFRYANGATSTRPMTVTVNGTAVAIGAPFGPTGSWDTWSTLTVTGKLNAGTNKVRATATSAMGGPNLDQLHLAPAPTGTPAVWELRARVSTCSQISNGLYKTDADSPSATVPVCGESGAVSWTADLDVDCNGRIPAGSPCDPTAIGFRADTFCHDSTGQPLDAGGLPYVVVPSPSSVWDYRNFHVACGSIVAVIHNDQVVYAVVGDTGPTAQIGAASYATAKGLGVADPNAGGIDSGVTYLVFQAPNPNRIEDHTGAVSTGQQLARDFVNAN